jgi:hypothetical protein
MDTIYADLGLLTHEDLEKLQLAVNGEVAIRIQNERLTRRIEKAISDAQQVGFNDTEISEIISDATVQARTGKADSSKVDKPVPTPPVMATPSNTTVPGPTNSKPSKL